jgi:uncharacterized protein YacL
VFVEIVRLFTVVLLTAVGFMIGQDLGVTDKVAAGAGMLGCLAGYIVGGFLGRLLERAVGVAERKAERVPIPQLICGILGGGLGGVMGMAIALPVALLTEPAIGLPCSGIALWLSMYLGYRIASHRTEELFAMIGLSTRPLVRARAYDDTDGFLVDSSAVMDTQLLPLCRSGLFRDDLLVPRFVLDELQGMADAGDERGRRARRGLETLDVLQRDAPNRVYIVDDEVPEVTEVDAKLVALARRLQVRLLTNDVNLARVAEVQGVLTVIPRRLAADLVPGVLAGETIHVALTRAGRHPGQGVGFLEDGSMVVVNGGVDLVNAGPMSFVVSSIVPTSAGRIVFARPEDLRRNTKSGKDGQESAADAPDATDAPAPVATAEVG